MNSTAPQCPSDVNAEVLSQTNLGATIGVVYIGVAISSAAYGITCIQTFQYYRSPRGVTDTGFLRFIVLLLWILDSTHQALIVHVPYHYLVLNYGNALTLLRTVWSIPTEIVLNAAIACIVEAFFVLRIWKLSKNIYVSCTCLVFTLAYLTTNLLFPIRIYFYPMVIEAEMKLKDLGCTGLGLAVLADVSISASLVYYLRRGRTGLRKSDGMIGRLVVLTVATGSLTTLCVIANLIAYLAAPEQLYVLFFNVVLGKLYINSVLTSLNSRTYVRGDNGATMQLNSIPLSTFQAQQGQISRGDLEGSTAAASLEEVSKGSVV